MTFNPAYIPPSLKSNGNLEDVKKFPLFHLLSYEHNSLQHECMFGHWSILPGNMRLLLYIC